MKIEIDDSKLINDIVEKVAEQIAPLFNKSHDSNHDELMDVQGLADYLKVKKQWVYEKTHMGIISITRWVNIHAIENLKLMNGCLKKRIEIISSD